MMRRIDSQLTFKESKLKAIKGEIVHIYKVSEPHVLDLDHECWCGLEWIEDFTGEGGGVLIVHQKVTWQ